MHSSEPTVLYALPFGRCKPLLFMSGLQTATSAQYFRALTILHSAFILGQVAFAGMALFLRTSGGFMFEDEKLRSILPLVAVALAVGGAASGAAFFRKRRDTLRGQTTLAHSLAGYRGAQIVRWALLEGPALFSIIAFLLTGVYWLLGVVALLIALFVSTRPSPRRAVQDLQLSHEDEARVLDPEAVVE